MKIRKLLNSRFHTIPGQNGNFARKSVGIASFFAAKFEFIDAGIINTNCVYFRRLSCYCPSCLVFGSHEQCINPDMCNNSNYDCTKNDLIMKD